MQAKLAKIQRLALIGATGAMKSTPSADIEAMLCLEPLHLFIEAFITILIKLITATRRYGIK